MHWWQGAFASKSHSDDDSVIVGDADSRYSLKPSFFSSGRSRHLTRARKLRHVTENDVQMWRSPSQGTHFRSPSESPQPLPLPELQVLLRRDPKFASSSSNGVPLPSPRDVIQNQRGCEEKEIGRSREREAAEGLDADAIDGLNGLKSRLAGQDTSTNSILSDIQSSRKSPQKLKVKDRSSNIYRISIPISAPTSPYSSPVLSPPRSDMLANHYLTPPSIFQVWSAPEIPHSDGHPGLGFFPQLASEKAASSVDNSPLQSPRLSSHVYGTSPPMTSPLPTKMSHETSLAPWESNAQATVHPLPLPPGVAVIPSRPSPVSPLSAKPELVPIKQRWQKGKLIGRGTFGSVYVASNRETGALCAMKEVEILPDDSKSAECIRQLEQEIKVLSHLKHPNIVQYFGSEIVGEKFYIYLEYVHPGSINKFIHDHCGAITESVVRNFTRHILCGLAYLHSKKTIHRDIKGANLLVDAYGVVKLADFGMAKHLTGQAANLSMRGSPYWMAPELLNFGMQKDAISDLALAVDIWSLGCTIIEMLTGKPPWSEYEGAAALFKVIKETPPIPETLSADGKDFLRRCFRRNPADRPTASKLLDHPFVNYSQQPEAYSKTSKERNLMDNMQFIRERLNQKSDSVPVSFDSQIKKAELSNKGPAAYDHKTRELSRLLSNGVPLEHLTHNCFGPSLFTLLGIACSLGSLSRYFYRVNDNSR
ncbi:mitogen-activated protein kinase kinase kinase YODA [Dorcoceras hygrometricum]|uniref:mitogen-activated protein kinase kinase kinase n=1 Tax=Dorcoceras hygrometricum TaxID=472368 RepID=A0A2Z7AV56_9LAMI|nr:mitogen-activated protein kinase kinase kinase YODA [Dorcoceras hygrometricum]